MNKITMLLALISLTFASFSVSTAQNIQAVSKYSEKWHTVKTTEKVYRYKPYVPRGAAMYQMKFIHKTPIKKGTYLKLRSPGTHYAWQIKRGGHYWAILRNDARWFKNVR
ncbi:hypothetical protein [Lactobacillus gallinarum]|nr:hypothetical protein [Lactobacillus gallinarum]